MANLEQAVAGLCVGKRKNRDEPSIAQPDPLLSNQPPSITPAPVAGRAVAARARAFAAAARSAEGGCRGRARARCHTRATRRAGGAACGDRSSAGALRPAAQGMGLRRLLRGLSFEVKPGSLSPDPIMHVEAHRARLLRVWLTPLAVPQTLDRGSRVRRPAFGGGARPGNGAVPFCRVHQRRCAPRRLAPQPYVVCTGGVYVCTSGRCVRAYRRCSRMGAHE